MSVPAFYLSNHSSSELHRAEDVAQLPSLFPSRHADFKTKDEFAKWSHDIGTKHCFYVLVEPRHPGTRAGPDNPPQWLYGVVADYDGDPAVIQAAIPHLSFPSGKAPTWVTTTFSGKARFIWLFEQRVPIFGPDVYRRFAHLLAKELKLKSLLPGLDEGALENLTTPYEVGRDWRQPYGDARLSQNLVMTALHDASAKAKWLGDADVPLDAIAAEVEKRFPGRWPGPFLEGVKGVRFWDPKADNQTGCTVRKTGMQAFTGEGRLVPWTEIFGADFVKQYRQSRIGGAIKGIYHDGQSYWQEDGRGYMVPYGADATARRLNVKFGLSKEAKKGQASEVAHALTDIEDLNKVDGAFPFLFQDEKVVSDGFQQFLNVSRVRVMPGTGQSRTWGEGFPWIADYLLGLFGEEQLQVFLSWIAHFYQSASAGKPRQGQALFIAGPAAAGKSLLARLLIGDVMGGFGDASDFVLGKTIFNEDLFYKPVWAIDDAEASSDRGKHAIFSQMVKKIVANPHQQYNGKFKKAVTQRWNGRLVVTLNDDPESIGMLPQIEHSNLDKMIILKAAAASSPGKFHGAQEIIRQELPAFADYIREFQIPEWLKTNGRETERFGHNSWHHPDLLAIAKDASSSAGTRELLEKWRVLHFRGTDALVWSGKVGDLLNDLRTMDGLAQVSRDVVRNRNALSKDLQTLVAQKTEWLEFKFVREVGDRYFITRPPDAELRQAA